MSPTEKPVVTPLEQSWLDVQKENTPASRQAFLEKLVYSSTLVLVRPAEKGQPFMGMAMLRKKDSQGNVSPDFVLCFTGTTSLNRWLTQYGNLTPGCGVVPVLGRDLIGQLSGLGLLVNPGSDKDLEISPDEIKAVTKLTPPPVAMQEQPSLVGEPSMDISELTEALSAAVQKMPMVVEGWICQVVKVAQDGFLLVGISHNGEWEDILPRIVMATQGHVPEGASLRFTDAGTMAPEEAFQMASSGQVFYHYSQLN